jgi:hypothetical protein
MDFDSSSYYVWLPQPFSERLLERMGLATTQNGATLTQGWDWRREPPPLYRKLLRAAGEDR